MNIYISNISKHQHTGFHHHHSSPPPALLASPAIDPKARKNPTSHKLCSTGFHNYNQASSKSYQKSKMSSHSISAGQVGFTPPDSLAIELAQEGDLSRWMMATTIDDDDLTFGGKSLSTWYEEDRRRLSVGDDGTAISPNRGRHEEERRGRQRQRSHYQHDSPQRRKKTRATKLAERPSI